MVNIGGANTGNDRRGLSFLVFVGIIGFSIARAVATFFTNYLWFDSVDLNSVWLKILITKSALVAATSLLAFAFIFLDIYGKLFRSHMEAIFLYFYGSQNNQVLKIFFGLLPLKSKFP